MGYEEWYKTALPGIRLRMATGDDVAVRILIGGRVQAIVCFLPDMNSYLNELSFSPEHPLFVSYDRITCHNNETGKQFVGAVSPKLKEMNEDGTMKKILGKYYLEWKYSEFSEWNKQQNTD